MTAETVTGALDVAKRAVVKILLDLAARTEPDTCECVPCTKAGADMCQDHEAEAAETARLQHAAVIVAKAQTRDEIEAVLVAAADGGDEWLSGRKVTPAGVPTTPSGIPAAAAPPGDAGPSQAVRKLVLLREGHRCACCGQPVLGRPYSVGLRKKRSQGGEDKASNLLTFLGLGINPLNPDDHTARIKSRRDPDDEVNGYLVRSWQDPADVPVVIVNPDGSRMTLWLDDAGRYRTEPPDGSA
jgi:hypothetical protein